MDYLIVTVLIAEVATLSWADRRIFGTWLTPFNLLSFPYTAVAVLAFFLAPALGFVSLYSPSVVIWEVGLLCFWAVGALMGWGFFGGTRIIRPFAGAELPGFREAYSTKLAIRLAWAITPVMAYGLYKSQRETGGWAQLGSYDFKVAYAHGLPAHAVQLAQPLTVLLIGTYRKGRGLQLVTIACLLLFLFLTGVKGIVLSSLIAAVIFRTARKRLKISVRKVALGLALTYAIFNAVYLVGLSIANPSILNDSSIYSFLARHYMYYLWAGVLSFSQALRVGVPFVGGSWYLIFAPFINIYRAVLSAGPPLVAISPAGLGMDIDSTNKVLAAGANVYTMLGTLYYYLGPFGALLIMVAFALLCYGLLLVCRRNNSDWLLVLYCTFGSWLAFGFFDYYFASLGFPETLFDCIVLAGLVKLVSNPRGPKAHWNPESHLEPRLS